MIPFNKPYMTGRELAYIAQAHANGHLSGDGAFTKRCHAWLEDDDRLPQGPADALVHRRRWRWRRSCSTSSRATR